MPHVLAALVRSAPSRTIASANIRRDAALSFSRPAATRSSMAVKSLWVTAIAAIVLSPLHTKSPSIQTFSDSGIPTSHPFSPLVLPRQFAASPRGGGNRPGKQLLATAGAHQHLQRGGGGAAGRGDVLPQRGGIQRRAMQQFAASLDAG